MAKPSNPLTHTEFIELLPFFVAGKLQSEDEALVSAYLSANPDEISAIHFTRQLAAALKSIGETRDVHALADEFVKKFEKSQRRRLTWWPFQPQQGWGKPLAGFALLVIVVQFAMIFNLIENQRVSLLKQDWSWGVSIIDAQLVPQEHFDGNQFFDIVHRHGARVVKSEAVDRGHRIFIDIDDLTQLKPMAVALAEAGIVNPNSVQIVVVNDKIDNDMNLLKFAHIKPTYVSALPNAFGKSEK